MNARKKTERRYTPIATIQGFIDSLREREEKVLFRYYGKDRVLQDMSYRQFADMVYAESAAFTALGLAGKRIAVVGETSPYWVATYLATIAVGGIIIPLDKELQITEMEGFLTRAGADAIAYSPAFSSRFAPMMQAHATVHWFFPMQESVCEEGNVLSLSRLLQIGTEEVEKGFTWGEQKDLDRVTEMLFTSGTTGTSKCVLLSERNVIASANAACETVNFCPEDVIVSVLPIHHTYELCCMLAAINYGMTVGINDSLKRVLKNFAVFRPTGLVLVPLFISTMYKKIWDEARKAHKARFLQVGLKASHLLRVAGLDVRKPLFSSVRAAFGGRLEKIVAGGAPLDKEMVVKFAEFGIDISEGYGITECSPLISVNPYFAPKSGSVGPAVPCCEVRIDPTGITNDPEIPYTAGEILVRGSNVMIGYDDEEATAEAFTEDGWFRTGDIGYLDEDGYIFVTGRKKSVIVLENGKNVQPEEIEEYLSQIDAIAEAVVVGRPSHTGEEVVLTAVVFPAADRFPAGTSKQAMQDAIRIAIDEMNHRLVRFKQVRAVEFRDTEFEKTTSRKIKRFLVR